MTGTVFAFLRSRWDIVIAGVLLLFGSVQAWLQLQERAYVQEVTHAVIMEAGATTPKQKVLALRDYLRTHVEFKNAPVDNRPFLRATAADTLQSGKGYCGEVSRTFICMARVLDIRTQRINLYGSKPHTVAEVELPDGQNWIVDCQNPPRIAGLEQLDKVMSKGDYVDYSTLNVRRLGVDWLVSRIKLQMGPLTYWSENPHALVALFFLSLASGFLLIRPMRWSVRVVLRRRGWIHESDKAKLMHALNLHGDIATRGVGA